MDKYTRDSSLSVPVLEIQASLHGGHIGRLKVHPWNYFCFFYSFERKLCRIVELCIPKNRMFFVFRF